MIHFLTKLSSRKFLLALVGAVSGFAIALGVEGEELTSIIASIGGVVTAATSIIAYIFGEAKIDAAAVIKERNGGKYAQ